MGWNLENPVINKDDPEVRDVYLETHTRDRGHAQSMREQLVRNYYGGKIPVPLSSAKRKVLEGGNRTTVSDFAKLHYEARRKQGVKRWDDERRLFTIHIEPAIGDRDPTTLTTWDLKQLLLKCKETPVKRHTKEPIFPANETLKKIRGELLRLFKEMMVAEIIEKNPPTPSCSRSSRVAGRSCRLPR